MNVNILVLDDEAIERRYLKTVLNRLCPGANIQASCRNGREGLELVRQLAIDMAFVDIKMPEIDGLTFARTLREWQPQTFIVIHTAYADFHFAQEAIAAHVDAYLLKPSKLSDIQDLLAQYARRQSVDLVQDVGDEPDTTESLIAGIDAFLRQHYCSAFTLEELGEELHYNPEHLSRAFRKQRGVTISQQQHQMRISKACSLLKTRRYSIRQIASLVGYQAVGHFYTQFKIFTGTTPKQYVETQFDCKRSER